MSDIVEFIRARLDEDEAQAREAVRIRQEVYAHQRWANEPDYAVKAWDDHPAGVVIVGPERVLREVEAKRKILEAAGAWPMHSDEAYAIQCVAAIYADHPDYDPGWS